MIANPDDQTLTLRMALDPLAVLRQVNAHLGSALARMQPQQTHCSAITPQDFSDLRRQIQRGAECISSLGADTIAATQWEANAYRNHLESLQQFLPDLQGRLLAEKSRLEVARDRVAATTAWARASQKTI